MFNDKSKSPTLSSLRNHLRKVDIHRTPPGKRLQLQTEGSVNHHVGSPPSPSNDRRSNTASPVISTPVRAVPSSPAASPLEHHPVAATSANRAAETAAPFTFSPSPSLESSKNPAESSANNNNNNDTNSVAPATLNGVPNTSQKHHPPPAGLARGPPSVRSVVSNHTRVTSSSPSSPMPPTTAATSIAASARTTLLLIVTDTLQPKIQSSLNSIINHHGIQEILLCATSDDLAKRLKMDCYTVVGKLSRDVVIQTLPACQPDSPESLATILDAQGRIPLYGVLLCLPEAQTLASSRQDTPPQLLDLDIDSMTRRWRQLILPVQTVARYALPLLGQTACTPKLSSSGTPLLSSDSPSVPVPTSSSSSAPPTSAGNFPMSSKPFFLVHAPTSDDHRALDPFHASVQSLLLQSIASSHSLPAQGTFQSQLQIGYTNDPALLPAPPTPVIRSPLLPINTDMKLSLGAGAGGSLSAGRPLGQGLEAHDGDDESQESPTKLYYLWAMQEES